ncbi:hypothetical protein BJ986_002832 [Phycicoccus badiiscoriae]|uniref:Uncharacterized protein n=1 Tax=Pedococcus badiiscoriae TaxID=642776 RepID=A0A852WQ47_9MICO|nr:hypothetical protein [Pedococcus badiiscoriae]NYG08345.1 hypothetical protein [Pedococcus badiiscoriae]
MGKWLVGGVAILSLGGLIGYGVGRDAAQPMWLTGSAHVSTMGRQASFVADGWSYGFMGSVSWIDAQGVMHMDGWPDCLTDQTKSARFEAESQAVDVIGKPVLAVDCR